MVSSPGRRDIEASSVCVRRRMLHSRRGVQRRRMLHSRSWAAAPAPLQGFPKAVPFHVTSLGTGSEL